MDRIIVTGASRGIGRYLCDELARDYEVIGVARNKPDDFGHEFIQADVSQAGGLEAGLRDRKVRRVYGLVNCAGIASMNLFLTTPLETMRHIVEVNTLGTMYACRSVLPALIRNGSGRIVNFSTIAVRLGLAGESVYVASKAAVEAFSQVLAKEVGTYDVTVNTIAPNPIDTDLIKGVSTDKIDRILAEQTIKRRGSFQDIDNMVRFLLDPKSSLISGQTLGLG